MTIFKSFVVGVLALQGAFKEHIEHLKSVKNGHHYCKFDIIEVKTVDQLTQCDALIIPGGESTSMSLIAERTNMLNPLIDYVSSGKPVWGTCAGLIFLSKEIINGRPGQKLIGGLDIQVKRNAFGRQLNSFTQLLNFDDFIPGLESFSATFIRAPVVSKILKTNYNDELVPIKGIMDDNNGDEVIHSDNIKFSNKAPVEILHKLENGFIVAVRQGNILGTSFHPELGDDIRFHKWFIDEFVLSSN